VVDELRAEHGVEPICRVLEVALSTYYAVKARERDPSARARRDAELIEVYPPSASREVWWQLQREGVDVARAAQ